MIRCLWGIVIALMLAGCAGHPLPDDVTRHSTLAIVKAIRCEAGAALQDTPSWADKGAIGLVFDFDIFEHNNATLGLDLKKIFPTGTFTMNVPPSTDLQREGHRRFTIVDALKDLKDLWKPSATACSQEAIQTNFAYPIVGTIGLNEVIHTAIGIDLLGAQGEAVTGVQSFPSGLSAVFSDELTYTTKIDTGMVNPVGTFNAVPGVLRLASVSGSFESDRKDVHKLTLAIALPDPPPATPKGTMRAAARSVPAQQAILGSRGIPSKVLIHGTQDPRIRVLWELDRRALLGQEDQQSAGNEYPSVRLRGLSEIGT